MKPQFELRIGPDGIIGSIYQDGLAELLEAEIIKVERASTVEWESMWSEDGWTVKAAHDQKLALRHDGVLGIVPSRDQHLLMAIFKTREEALEAENKFFWDLLNG